MWARLKHAFSVSLLGYVQAKAVVNKSLRTEGEQKDREGSTDDAP